MEKRRVRKGKKKGWRKNNSKIGNNWEKESQKGSRNFGQRVTVNWLIMGRRRIVPPLYFFLKRSNKMKETYSILTIGTQAQIYIGPCPRRFSGPMIDQ